MLDFLSDKFRTWRLRARFERLAQERVLQLVESRGPQAVAEDAGDWSPLGSEKPGHDSFAQADLRTTARRLVATNPHAANALRLLENYVVGPGFRLTHEPRDDGDRDLARTADRLCAEFLAANRPHFTFREYARRAWRDGETFLRVYDAPAEWPPPVRFVDPEAIDATPDHPDCQGILTEPGDVEQPLGYLRVDPVGGKLVERIPADEMLHTRVGIDSNVKRGVSIFEPVAPLLECFEQWRDVELQARKLQASIVLWRKVQGGPSRVSAVADAAESTGPTVPSLESVRRERYRGGTILTTSAGTDLQFLQPDTNFGDAVPLGRMLLLSVAAGVGLPEFMLTSDASNANYSSTMVAEGPAVKRFESEQRFFADEFERLWRMVIRAAVRSGRLPGDALERLRPSWTFPNLVTRDRARERAADVRLVDRSVLSRAEVARRDGVDPAVMQRELADESA